MKNWDRVTGTIVVWTGTFGFTYFFNTIDKLAGSGAFGLVLLGNILTGIIWDKAKK